MTQVARYEPTGDLAIDRAVKHWGQASLLPKAYRLDNGSPDWPNLVIAATVLRLLDVEPFPSLPDTYVVGGRVGLMAALQIALAQRADAYPEVVESDDRHAVARLLHGSSWGCAWCLRPAFEGHYAEVDYEYATKAGWTKRNPNYGTMPRAMLEARALTALLRRTAPGVLRGIASTVAPVATLDTEGAPVLGGVGVGSHTPPASPDTPGYYTVEIPGAMRSELLARIRRLDDVAPEVAAELRAEWKALRGPVLTIAPEVKYPAYLPDALVLRYMLDEAEGALEASGGVVQEDGPTPTDLHDAAAESRGMEPDDEAPSYAPDDPARPF